MAKILIKDEQIVTYHSFSHNLGIHVDRAKMLLCEFYKAHRDHLSAAFIVSGSGLVSGETLIKYCNDETAMNHAASTLFASIYSIFVYGLVSKRIADASYGPDEFASVEALIMTSFDDRSKYYKCGMFAPSVDITEGQVLIENTRSLPAKPIAKPRENPKSPLKLVKSSGLTSGYVSRKPKSVDLSIKFPAATTSKKRPLNVETPVSKYQYKSRKSEPKRDRVIVSTSEIARDDAPEPEKSKSDAVKLKQQAADLEKMFEQSFTALEDEAEAESESAEPIAVEHEVFEQNASEVQPLEAVDADSEPDSNNPGSIHGFFAPTNDPQDQSALFVTEEEQAQQDGIDEDGFITLYSAKKATPKPIEQSRARSKQLPAKLSTKSKPQRLTPGNMKQGNLMSFFGK